MSGFATVAGCSLITTVIPLRWRWCFSEFTVKSFPPAPDVLGKPTYPVMETNTRAQLHSHNKKETNCDCSHYKFVIYIFLYSEDSLKLCENICSISLWEECSSFWRQLVRIQEAVLQVLTCHSGASGMHLGQYWKKKKRLKAYAFKAGSQPYISSFFRNIFQLFKSLLCTKFMMQMCLRACQHQLTHNWLLLWNVQDLCLNNDMKTSHFIFPFNSLLTDLEGDFLSHGVLPCFDLIHFLFDVFLCGSLHVDVIAIAAGVVAGDGLDTR